MIDVITIVLLSLFATYGLISLLREIAFSFRDRIAEESDGFRLALIVKDCQEDVEWAVRRIMDTRLPAASGYPYRLTIVDLNSTDETPLILNKLCREYPGIELLGEEERYRIFDTNY